MQNEVIMPQREMNCSEWERRFILFIFQGWISLSFCEDWSFTFPESITVFTGSSVTIPCTFTSPKGYSDVHIIWYTYNVFSYIQVFNSKDPSAVLPKYRGRTFLVGNDTNSCSLRIDGVIENKYFYPGINDNINSLKLQRKKVFVIISDWIFVFPKFIQALNGSCVEIPCSFTYKKHNDDSNLIWFGYHLTHYPQIFNKRNPTFVESDYKGHTSLVGNRPNSCSLRIDNVQHNEQYFPGISSYLNSYTLNNQKIIRVKVTDSVFIPLIKGADYMQEGKTVSIFCTVLHTCSSSPPSLEWNKAGHPISVRHEDISGGYWTVQSEIRYSPSYQDHNTSLECTATFQNGKQLHQNTILHIRPSCQYTLIFGVTGATCFAMFLLNICLCWRLRKSRGAAHRNEDSSKYDATYADLQKKDIDPDYDEMTRIYHQVDAGETNFKKPAQQRNI
ncbi:B-cell receptor CD22-like isoform X2 [Pelobates cultripes]|uniref:B-cell receptor CD22-like isoform X2 n=2 Tax=Pelobates cultripes TaxID=61616 RepID=A0AAD1T824_PELCU|nr:B-cell receptor CD22-like isoform X2 [Pelobates cultripes]CAH2318627.1 B-cell receptor CD22-like isoform X2 [Pelobates cultripes]